MIIEEIKKRFALFAIVILLVISIVFTIRAYSIINTIDRGVTGLLSEFEPSHKCESRELSFYCFSLSSTMKTCYTLPNRIGGKRCLVEPYWSEIIYDEQEPECLEYDCPEYEETTCPIANLTCPVIPCIQTCYGCGGGGGRSCPTTCPPVINCDNINCIAYIDNDEGGIDKWFCDSCTADASCVKDGTLEMPWG